MRLLVIVLTLSGLVMFAAAGSGFELGQTLNTNGKSEPAQSGGGGGDGREGGETVDDAFPIPALPYTDTGNTCDNIDDYEEMCPYGGSLAPDVVYAYTTPVDDLITIDLCASAYDTKLFVYEDAATPGQPYACNDDAGCGYSGYQSRIENLPLFAGHTYFIVIDGYSTASCGDYDLSIVYYEECHLECPPGSMLEGEPPLVENYVDEYNSGCSHQPPLFQQLPGNATGHLDFCGHSGTYLYMNLSYRDTDWFTCFANGSSITATITAEFATYLFQVSTDCNTATPIETVEVEPCESGSIDFATTPGEEVWLWVGPVAYGGVPEYTYILEVDGIDSGATAVDGSTWGAVKAQYRR